MASSSPIWSVVDSTHTWPRESTVDDVDYVLHGRFDHLPPAPSKVVRIFLSSTFTDTYVERNLLIKRVYPKLQRICKEKYDLDFQVVDMRWGVRNEATVDHSASTLCMQEIEACKKLSIGPTFVALLSHRYGGRPLPSILLQDEMTHLIEEIESWEKQEEALTLVQKWYKLDQNALPNEYVLQPIISQAEVDRFLQEPERLRNKYDYLYAPYLPKPKTENVESAREKKERYQSLVREGQEIWKTDEPKLTKILRSAANKCFEKGTMTDVQKRKFFQSVTEEEIRRGLIEEPNKKDRCLVFRRTIKNINTHNNKAWRFIDQHDDRSLDIQAQDLLSHLRNVEIPENLPRENIFDFTTTWSDNEGINEKDHAEYLEEFIATFEKAVLGLIEKRVEKRSRLGGYFYVYDEVLDHCHQCVSKVAKIHGREDELQEIKQYLMSTNDQPLIVHGESGCGKTSVLAKMALQIPSWLGDSNNVITVLRFLGTTLDSTSICKTLSSLAHQIIFSTGLQNKYTKLPSEFSELKDTFRDILHSIASPKRVVIILDSLDQLSGEHGAHKLMWFPKQLPPNVKLIASVLSEAFDIVDRLTDIEESNFLQIQRLKSEVSRNVLKLWLGERKRTVTKGQEEIVNQLVDEDTKPLYLKLIFDEICSWKSYDKPLYKCPNITSCLHRLFKKLEIKHGEVLVKKALGYLCASRHGLTENEMEDILSLDEEVLSDVFEFHVPPIRRLPSVLWSRIRSDIGEYIVNRDADGSKVMAWYHRQSLQEACKRYRPGLSDFSHNPTRNVANLPLYKNLSEYFAGIWAGNKPKPFTYTESQCKKLKLESNEAALERYVREQPTIYTSKDGSIDIENMRYNRRKISELPHACEKVSYNEDYITFIAEHVALNQDFLIAWVSMSPLEEISQIMRSIARMRPSETRCLIQVLKEELQKEVQSDSENTVRQVASGDLGDYSWPQLTKGTLGLQLQISAVLQGLLLSYVNVEKNPSYLGSDLTGRLLHYSEHLDGIANWTDQTDFKGRQVCALVPPYLHLESPGSELVYQVNNHVGPVQDCEWSESNGHVFISVSRKFMAVSLKDGEVLADAKPLGLLEGDCFSKVTTIVSKNYKPVYLSSLQKRPYIYAFSEDGEILKVFDVTKEISEDLTISDLRWFYLNRRENESCVVVVDYSKNVTYYINDILNETAKCTAVGDPNCGKVVAVFMNKHRGSGKVLILKDTGTWELLDKTGQLLDKKQFDWPTVHVVSKDMISPATVTSVLVGFTTGQVCLIHWLLEQNDLKAFTPFFLFTSDKLDASRGQSVIAHHLYHCEQDEPSDSDGVTNIVSLGISCSDSDLCVFGSKETIPITAEEEGILDRDPRFDFSLKVFCRVKKRFDMAVFTPEMKFIIATQDGIVYILKVDGLKDLTHDRLHLNHFATLHAHSQKINKILLSQQETLFLTSSEDASLKFFLMDRIGKTRKYLPQFDHSEHNIQQIIPGTDMAITFSDESKIIHQWNLKNGSVTHVFHHSNVKKFIKCATDDKFEILVALDDNGYGYMWKLHTSDTCESQSLKPTTGQSDAVSHVTEHVQPSTGPFPWLQPDFNLEVTNLSFEDVFMLVLACDTAVVAFKNHPTAYLMYVCENGEARINVIADISGPFQHILKMKNHQSLFITTSVCYLVSSETKQLEWQCNLIEIVDCAELVDVCYVESSDEVVYLTANKLVFWKPTNAEVRKTCVTLGGTRSIRDMRLLQSQTTRITVLDSIAKQYCAIDVFSKENIKLRELSKENQPAQYATMTPDGHYLVYVCNDKDLYLLRLSDGKLLAWYTMYDTVQSLSVSSNSWYVLVGTSDRRLFVLLIADPLERTHDQRITEVRKNNRKYSREDVLMLIGDINDYLTDADETYIAHAKAALEYELKVEYPSDMSQPGCEQPQVLDNVVMYSVVPCSLQ